MFGQIQHVDGRQRAIYNKLEIFEEQSHRRFNNFMELLFVIPIYSKGGEKQARFDSHAII
jgi:hypothetical protein